MKKQKQDYGRLVDEHSARGINPDLGDGGDPGLRPSRGQGSDIEMRGSLGAGRQQRSSQRASQLQGNQSDAGRVGAGPQSSAYQQIGGRDSQGSKAAGMDGSGLGLGGLKSRIIKFNNFNFVLRGIPNNKINNQRYSLLSFLPIVLFDQFKYFFNLFFLLVCLSQLFEPLRVGFLISYLAPLLFVLAVTMIKEFYEDYKRGQRDKELNQRKYKRLDCHSGIIREVMAQDIRVGDIVQVSSNERVPADMVCLFTTDKSSTAYIRTDQLDGETDWKVRRPIVAIQNEMYDYKDIGSFFHCEARCEPPSNKIYEFNGLFVYPGQPGDAVSRPIQEPLGLDNTMWANTVVASQGFVLGLILYTGKETRAQLNQKKARSKMCLLDMEVNSLSKLLFALMVFLALGISILNGFNGHEGLFFLRCVLLLSSIIPISLRVNLDLAKLYYSYGVNTDEEIPGTMARNSNIPEDLGRLQYLITDKTGTLTQNEMLLKKVCTELAIFETDDPNRELEKILTENCAQYPQGPCNDAPAGGQSSMLASDAQAEQRPKKKKKRDHGNNVRDLITAFALCNNVTPVAEDPDIAQALEVKSPEQQARKTEQPNFNQALGQAKSPDKLKGRGTMGLRDPKSPASPQRLSGGGARTILQASSPDEVALVKYSNQTSLELIERDRTTV